MNSIDRKQVRGILNALVKQNKYSTLNAAARILFAEAATEQDAGFKRRLLVLAGRVQALQDDETAR